MVIEGEFTVVDKRPSLPSMNSESLPRDYHERMRVKTQIADELLYVNATTGKYRDKSIELLQDASVNSEWIMPESNDVNPNNAPLSKFLDTYSFLKEIDEAEYPVTERGAGSAYRNRDYTIRRAKDRINNGRHMGVLLDTIDFSKSPSSGGNPDSNLEVIYAVAKDINGVKNAVETADLRVQKYEGIGGSRRKGLFS